MTTTQAVLITIVFAAASLAIGMGALLIVDWIRARKDRK